MGTTYWMNRLCHPHEADAILRLVRTVHGDRYPELNQRYWQWRYFNETEFRAEVVMAEYRGEPIGIQPVAVFEFQWGVERLHGAMYTGVMTHPDHRRQGVFRSLLQTSNEYARSRGARFSMTLPNDASLPGFLKSSEWSYQGTIPVYVKVADGQAMLAPKVGRLAAGLAGWLPQALFRRRRDDDELARCEIEHVGRVPEELDEVADRFARDCGALTIRRTANYWNWRYGEHPFIRYRTLLARRGAELVGAVVTAVTHRLGIDTGMIMDVVARDGMPVLRRLLRAGETDLCSNGAGLVVCQATCLLLQTALKREGYLCPTPRLLPKRFHFVYRPIGVESPPRLPGQLADWHLTFGDSDNA